MDVTAGKVAGDLIWSLAAMLMLNGAIQILIYPYLQRRIGVAAYGDMLYQIAVITILGAGLGLAVNNFRLLHQKDEGLKNGDYLYSLLILVAAGCVPVALLMRGSFTAPGLLLYLLLAVCIALRYYSDVAYRITLDYRSYFVYYCILTLGYALGLLLWPVLRSWVFVLLLGEAGCVLFCALRGGIYRPLEKRTALWSTQRQILPLAASYLLYNAVIQMDRVLLRHLLGSEAVSVYYVASLLGKIIALLVGPLNSVLLSYLSKMKQGLTQKAVWKLLAAVAAVSALFYGAICIAAPLACRLLYPDIDCAALLARANLGQVLCFSGSILLTVLLTLAPSYWQLLSQGLYAALFVALGWWGAAANGLEGFVNGTLAANLARCVMVVAALLLASGMRRNRDASAQEGVRLP